jgi:hypothetical protein
MPNETEWDAYLIAILDAVVSGRIEAKTLRDMTPEQRAAYRERLLGEEKNAIAEGLARHDVPLDVPEPGGE